MTALETASSSSPTADLLDFVASVRERPLEEDVLAATRQLAVDTLACYVGGTGLRAAATLLRHAKRAPGRVRLFPLAEPVSEAAGAFAAAQIANLLDADDTFYARTHHACVTFMPVLIAGAGSEASLGDALRASAIAFEVGARLLLSCQSQQIVDPKRNAHDAYVFGSSWTAPALAVGLGLVRGFDDEQLANAFNLAAYMAPVPTNAHWYTLYPPESMTKYFMYGGAARAAFDAVELTEVGFVGPVDTLDGPRGFRRIIGAQSWDDRVLGEGIGDGVWAVSETSLKRYPACRLWNGALGGLEKLVAEHDVRSSDVEHVDVRLARMQVNAVRLSGERPQLSETSASMSVPWACAHVLQGHEPGPSWLLGDGLNGAETRDLMARIEVGIDPELNAAAAEELARVGHVAFNSPWRVTVRLKSGGELVSEGKTAPGDPFDPLMRTSRVETDRKFVKFYGDVGGSAEAAAKVLSIFDADSSSCADLLAALH
jgi:2-methylcitrate dehydratase PrpD